MGLSGRQEKRHEEDGIIMSNDSFDEILQEAEETLTRVDNLFRVGMYQERKNIKDSLGILVELDKVIYELHAVHVKRLKLKT